MPDRPTQPHYINTTVFGLGQDTPPTWPSPIPANTGIETSIRVLLVEDDPVTRWLVRSCLLDTCTLQTAPDGARALEICNSHQPDLVFLDIGLPDLDGLLLLKKIKTAHPGIKVVMFSARANPETMMDALQSGASGYINKPFHRAQLVRHIEDLTPA